MYDNVDWYEVLGVSPEASEAEIELAWRYKVYEAHPDRNGSADAHERTKLLNMARDTLLDKNRRRKFDWQRAEGKRQEEAQRQERARRQKEKKQGKLTGCKYLRHSWELSVSAGFRLNRNCVMPGGINSEQSCLRNGIAVCKPRGNCGSKRNSIPNTDCCMITRGVVPSRRRYGQHRSSSVQQMQSGEWTIWKHSWMTSVGTSEYICVRRNLTDGLTVPTIRSGNEPWPGETLHLASCDQL